MKQRIARRAIDAASGIGPQPIDGYPHFRRNYTIGILNGFLFNAGLSFFNKTTVIPVFLAGLGAPSIVIAITSLFENLGWHLPQLFASKLVIHKPQKMPLYRIASAVRLLGLALVVGSALLVTDAPLGALAMFVGGYGLFSIAGGFSGIVFTDVVAKTTPKERRGSYFGWRAILAGIAGLYIGANVVKPVFAYLGTPRSYVVVFAIGSVLIALSFLLFMQVKEPVQTGLPPKRSMKAHLTTARRLMAVNVRFRRFVVFKMLLMLWFAAVPFYMLFAKAKLGATDADMGTFISWEFAGLIVSNVFWSSISNRVGNRTVLLLTCGMAISVSLCTLAYATGVIALPMWTFGMVFFMGAGIDSGAGNGGLNYALEIVPEAERATYVGLMNSLIAAALGVAGIVGSLRDVIGYTGLFAVTLGVAVASLVLIVRLPEPRRQARIAA